MNSDRIVHGVVPFLMVVGVSSMVCAAESSSTMPAAPASSVSTPTPQTSAQEGSITALDLKSAAPSIQVTGKEGKVWTLAIDPLATTVWENGMPAKWDSLKVGSHVKVRYTEKSGKVVAKSIQLVQEPSASEASSTTAPASSY